MGTSTRYSCNAKAPIIKEKENQLKEHALPNRRWELQSCSNQHLELLEYIHEGKQEDSVHDNRSKEACRQNLCEYPKTKENN